MNRIDRDTPLIALTTIANAKGVSIEHVENVAEKLGVPIARNATGRVRLASFRDAQRIDRHIGQNAPK